MNFLERIDAVPWRPDDFSYEFRAWLSILVDTLNSIIQTIEDTLLSINPLTSATQLAQINSQYICQAVAQTVITLPDYCDVGDTITIQGEGAGGWRALPGVNPDTLIGQTIKVASVGGSASVSITSSSRYDSISIMCVVQNTTWICTAAQTTGFVIV